MLVIGAGRWPSWSEEVGVGRQGCCASLLYLHGLVLEDGEVVGQLGYTLATAESLTGGLVGAQITSVSGASDYYLGGIISYATAIKNSVLDVNSDILSSLGAVSEEAAVAMAIGARRLFGASVGLSTTGVAGPTMQEGKPTLACKVLVGVIESVVSRNACVPDQRVGSRHGRPSIEGGAW